MADRDVLFVHSRLCARTYKQARALRAAGARVHLIETGTPSSFYDYSPFDTHRHLDAPRDVRGILLRAPVIRRRVRAAMRKISHDIVHSHNAPDVVGVWAAKGTRRPLVHDIHDSQTILPTLFSSRLKNRAIDVVKERWERAAIRHADALLTPSPRMTSYYRGRYDLDAAYSFENKVEPIEFAPQAKWSATDGKVHVSYAGGLTTVPGAARNLWDTFAALSDDDIQVHVYSVNFSDAMQSEIMARCAALPNVHYHKPLGGRAYFEEMSRYDYGLIWFNRFDKNLEFATANRMYELPLVGCAGITNMTKGYIGEFMARGGRGIVSRDIDEVKRIIRSGPSWRLDSSDCHMDGTELLAIYDDVEAAAA